MLHSYAIVALFVATLLSIVNCSHIFGHDSEIGLLNYMARSNELMQQDPTRSLDCFNKYKPLITEIANNYEINFKTCLNESESARFKADEGTLQQRNKLANAAEASCNLLKQCPENQAVEDIFQCFIEGGSGNIKTMYTIDANASQYLAELRENYYLIRNREYKCTNETKRLYEKKSAEAYAGLNNCILGNDDVAVVTPATKETTSRSAGPDASESSEITVPVLDDTAAKNPTSTSESIWEITEDETSDTFVNLED